MTRMETAVRNGPQLDEKALPLSGTPSCPTSSRCHPSSPSRPSSSSVPPNLWAEPQHYAPAQYRSVRALNLWRSWLPVIAYAATSLAFVVAFAWYRDELFAALDHLSSYLQADEQFGHALLFGRIFLTTIPPVPLYSTLIILSGYTFGWQTGAIISYFAALTGAIMVFLVSRTLLHDCISSWLQSTCTIKRVVRAIEKRPKLLFLIRLAPYPYNVMNCLLAASPTLTFRTYTICTALSLFKVAIHTSVGASIHSFRDYHVHGPEDDASNSLARSWTIIGVGLCIAILVYLAIVARRAVDEELDDDEELLADSEERVVFLASNDDVEACRLGAAPPRPSEMAESPFSLPLPAVASR